MVLEQSQAVGVDGADERRPEPIQEVLSLDLGDPSGNASFEALGRPLGEREGDDVTGLDAFLDERGHPACDGLGLAGAGAGDHLQVAARWAMTSACSVEGTNAVVAIIPDAHRSGIVVHTYQLTN
jgi:hypothetical protein